ncbi:MAG: class I SAM-dependent methyltransferase [Solirubrobacteraceae bacterium]
MSSEGPTGEHWNATYAGGDEGCSWTQAHPARSLEAIAATGAPKHAPIIDVGGGSSSLAGALLAAGYTDVTVLDISPAALRLARDRLGERAREVAWLTADVLAWRPARRYAVWHDRAVLHFFCDEPDRRAYADTLRAALVPGGHVIIATFAPDGPDRCSGLPVRRSSAGDILELLVGDFAPVRSDREDHRTPSGALQPFTWVVARRIR